MSMHVYTPSDRRCADGCNALLCADCGLHEGAGEHVVDDSERACEHGQLPTNEHTCEDGVDGEPHEDCFICACCGNCREDVDSNELCSDCGGVDEDHDDPELEAA